jgi:hypothetical protein
MLLNVTESEVVSLEDYEKTDIENVFINKDRHRVAFLHGDRAIVVFDEFWESLTEHAENNDSQKHSNRPLMLEIAMEVETFMSRATGDMLDYIQGRLEKLPCGGDSRSCHRR